MFGDNPQNQSSQNGVAGPAGAPDDNISSFNMDGSPASTPVSIPAAHPVGAPLSSDNPEPTDAPAQPDDTATIDNDTDSSDLISIKQQALQQLSPMLKHLDQTPEEKFRTTMMMIQANDDQSLIPEAYAAAQQISNEKEKAQALLDVVNEINYFTSSDKED